jgi:excisionase family DNA binding protein
MKRAFHLYSTIFQLRNNEAAQLAGVSTNHIREAIKAGKLKVVKDAGRGFGKVKRTELEAYVRKL